MLLLSPSLSALLLLLLLLSSLLRGVLVVLLLRTLEELESFFAVVDELVHGNHCGRTRVGDGVEERGGGEGGRNECGEGEGRSQGEWGGAMLLCRGLRECRKEGERATGGGR